MNARELHDITKGLIDKQVDRLCYGTDERQIVLRALDLLARVEESEDELVRELRDQADEERQFEYPERAKLLDMAAATIVALKAERDELKRHAEAMHEMLGRVMPKLTPADDADLLVSIHNERIAYRASQEKQAMNLPELNDGELLAGLCMVDCKPSHWLILLPATTDKDLTWQEAIDWAKSVGGELPSRFESALLYANLRDKIDRDYWYWTATTREREPAWAWSQSFSYGTQYYYLKDGYGRARAVRRVPFTEKP